MTRNNEAKKQLAGSEVGNKQQSRLPTLQRKRMKNFGFVGYFSLLDLVR